jgi:tetratricopeptide (TPR) repeat protein
MAYNNLGAEYAKAREFNKAIQFCSKVIQLKPSNEMAHANIANAFFQLKNYAEALNWYAKVIQISGKNVFLDPSSYYRILPNVYRDMGVIYARRGQYDLALEAFSEAIKIRPHFPEAYKRLGMVHASLHRFTEAISFYRKALPYLSDDAYLHNNLGVAYLMSGEIDKSIVHFKRALEISPGLNEIKLNLDTALKAKKKSNIER